EPLPPALPPPPVVPLPPVPAATFPPAPVPAPAPPPGLPPPVSLPTHDMTVRATHESASVVGLIASVGFRAPAPRLNCGQARGAAAERRHRALSALAPAGRSRTLAVVGIAADLNFPENPGASAASVGT